MSAGPKKYFGGIIFKLIKAAPGGLAQIAKETAKTERKMSASVFGKHGMR